MPWDVFYPGLETHRNHDVAKKQMRDFGGMMNGPEVGLAVPVHEAKVFLRQALGPYLFLVLKGMRCSRGTQRRTACWAGVVRLRRERSAERSRGRSAGFPQRPIALSMALLTTA